MARGSPKPPRHRWLMLLGGWVDVNRELDTGDDRAKAIVGAAYVENNLALAVLARLRFLQEPGQKHLYDSEYAAMRDFSAKIDIGWALNLYDAKPREDLHRIRKMRNKFAHELNVRSFDHPEVSIYCDKLIGVDYIDIPSGHTRPRSRRERYIDLVAHFGERFAMDSATFHRPPPSQKRIRNDY
jgi:hypothetical protein